MYLRTDPYLNSDAVFGVKNSLVVDMPPIDKAKAAQYLSPDEQRQQSKWSVLEYDFVLVTEASALGLRNEKSIKALEELGKSVTTIDGLIVWGVD